MSRYYKQFALSMSHAQAEGIIADFMNRNGFAVYTKKGETCYKKGNGILTGPQFIKITFGQGTVTVEAWIKFAVLPGVYCQEQDLTGAMGFALKNSLKAKVDYLEAKLGFIPGVTPVFMPVYAPTAAPAPAPMQSAPVPTVPTAVTVPTQPPVTPVYTNPAPVPSVSFCPNCGTKASAADKFCKSCGTALKR